MIYRAIKSAYPNSGNYTIDIGATKPLGQIVINKQNSAYLCSEYLVNVGIDSNNINIPIQTSQAGNAAQCIWAVAVPSNTINARYVNIKTSTGTNLASFISIYEMRYTLYLTGSVTQNDATNFTVTGTLKDEYNVGFSNNIDVRLYDTNNTLVASYSITSDGYGNYAKKISIVGIANGTYNILIRSDEIQTDNEYQINIQQGGIQWIQQITGSVQFISVPAGAEIYLDNVDTNKTTPDTITNVSVGSHSYTLKLTGFQDISDIVNVIEGENIISVTFTPNQGCIYFISNPIGAEIFIDNVDTGYTTPNMICGLSLATHTYKLVLPGYSDVNGNVTLQTGAGILIISQIATPVSSGNAMMLIALSIGVVGLAIFAHKKSGEIDKHTKKP
jgi:hypothetical protein